MMSSVEKLNGMIYPPFAKINRTMFGQQRPGADAEEIAVFRKGPGFKPEGSGAAQAWRYRADGTGLILCISYFGFL